MQRISKGGPGPERADMPQKGMLATRNPPSPPPPSGLVRGSRCRFPHGGVGPKGRAVLVCLKGLRLLRFK